MLLLLNDSDTVAVFYGVNFKFATLYMISQILSRYGIRSFLQDVAIDPKTVIATYLALYVVISFVIIV